jgi:hypothetical protein
MCVHVMLQNDESAVSVAMRVTAENGDVSSLHSPNETRLLPREETRFVCPQTGYKARSVPRLCAHRSGAHWLALSQPNCELLG